MVKRFRKEEIKSIRLVYCVKTIVTISFGQIRGVGFLGHIGGRCLSETAMDSPNDSTIFTPASKV